MVSTVHVLSYYVNFSRMLSAALRKIAAVGGVFKHKV